MKSKVFGFKILFVMLAVLTAGWCFGVGVKPASEKPVAVAKSTKVELNVDLENGKKENFSALFDGNVIFSVEKVYTSNTTDEGEGLTNAKTFYYGRNDESYQFKHIVNGGKSKIVVDNGEFVVFNNKNKDGKFALEEDSSVQESLMISFGAYYFNQDDTNFNIEKAEVEEHGSKNGAKIENLSVSVKRNGEDYNTDEIVTREYFEDESAVPFYDFVWKIDQKTDNANEGFYELTFNYMIDETTQTAYFSFYLINRSAFEETLDDESSAKAGYNAVPTVGWFDNENDTNFKKSLDGGMFQYYSIGKHGYKSNNSLTYLTYPTITYDYTKYRVNYTHNANGVNTKWKFDWKKKESLTNAVEMVYESSNSQVVKSGSFDLVDYSKDNKVNLVTILLTEPGNYTVEYSAYYSGYNQELVEQENKFIGIEPGVLKFNINGFNAKYSKANQASAKLDYYEVANANNNQIDLFIPNGYDIDKGLGDVLNADVGFVYKLNTQPGNREGFITKELSSALKNSRLATLNVVDGEINKMIAGWNEDGNKKKGLADSIGIANNKPVYGGIDYDIDNTNTGFDAVFKDIQYASTNQGSVWLTNNDASTNRSFYIYSAIKPEAANLFNTIEGVTSFKNGVANKFTNSTTFNRTGYYLVFIEVKGGSSSFDSYWQVFAFQYTSSAVNINIEAINGDSLEIIEGGKFTNKNVQISWKKPGVFDREITPSYFASVNKTLSRDELLKTTEYGFKKEQIVEEDGFYKTILGEDVQKGSFVKYLIKMVGEKASASYKIFTIDRQDISGVKPYLVSEMYFGHVISYALTVDDNNNAIWVNNSITDSLATVMWDKKESGANISATYNFIPFVRSADAVEKIGSSITTNYKLGTEITKTFTPVSDITDIRSSSVLFDQGIYLFKIVDDAGNGCLFMFVVDKTENYFEITLGEEPSKYIKNELVVYGNDVKYNIGSSKLVKLDLTGTSSLVSLVTDFLNNKDVESLTKDGEFKYYHGKDHNIETIKRLFRQYNDGESYSNYLEVKNNNVIAYTMQEDVDSTIVAVSGTLKDKKQLGETYYKRILYAVGENHKFTTRGNRKLSNVTIEINKDNSLLYVHYGFVDGKLNSKSERLDTGSGSNEDFWVGLKGAFATSADNIAISWIAGTGKYEVDKVELKRFELDLEQYTSSDKATLSGCNFYVSNQNASIITGTDDEEVPGRVVYTQNGWDDGLYVVTRTYVNADEEDFGEDVAVQTYFFIVDSNKIIDSGAHIGELIELQLLEEASFSTFVTVGSSSIEFEYSKGDVELRDKVPYVYLKTNKVPVTLRVPAGKFDRILDEGIATSSTYWAGRLNVQIFFKDSFYQWPLGHAYRHQTEMIFDSNQNKNNGAISLIDGYIEIDLRSCLSDVELVKRTVGDDSSWMFLPGEYVVRIYDNVYTDEAQNRNEKFIGFVIPSENKGPNGSSSSDVKILTGYNNNNVSEAQEKGNEFTYVTTVSQEYLEVVIPQYDKDEASNPMIDTEYLEIVQFMENVTTGQEDSVSYFSWPTDFHGENVVQYQDKDIAYGVILDTMLRDKNGNIIVANLNRTLRYEITIRYKVGAESKYEDCYVYFDEQDKLVSYCYAKIIVVIDRQAPTGNITNLNNNDSMVNDYVLEHSKKIPEVQTMTENDFIDLGSYVYFNHQYSAYYKNEKKDKGYIYAYQINGDSEFVMNDVDVVYYNPIDFTELPTYNLTLPFIPTEYSKAEISSDITPTYLSVVGGVSGFYEIIEQDAAGNTTQYVVYISDGETSTYSTYITIPVQVLRTNSTEESVSLKLQNDSNINVLHLYDIKSSDAPCDRNDYNFIIELYDGVNQAPIYQELTSLSTNFKMLSSRVVEKIKDQEYGNFQLVLKGRTITDEGYGIITNKYIINLYDEEHILTIRVEDLIENTNDGYKLFFNKALVKDEERELVYYATDISIAVSTGETYLFTGEYDVVNKLLKFKNENGEEVSEFKFDKKDAVYQIVMIDVLTKSSKYRFSPSGTEFYKVEFENPDQPGEWGDFYYCDTDGVYYGYTQARVVYAENVFKAYKKTGTHEEEYATKTPLTVKYDDSVNEEYVITIFEGSDTANNDEFEKEYKIVIGSNLGNVTLRDYSTGDPQDVLKQVDNANFATLLSDQSLTGNMILQWENIESEHMQYVYILHEQLKDGSYRLGEDGTEGVKLQGMKSCFIDTRHDSAGKYVFEIRVYGADGVVYLGNRLFAFEVQKANDKVYYVRDSQNVVLSNSTFNISQDGIANVKNGEINTDINYPLYITNTELTIVPVGSLVAVEEIYSNGNLAIYKIGKKDSFSLFIGILTINEFKGVEGVRFVAPNIDEQVLMNTDYVVTKYATQGISNEVNLHIDFVPETTNKLLAKNKLFLDVYFENQLVDSNELVSNQEDIENMFVYSELGNGKYSYVIRDLAGNRFKYANESDTVNVSVLREVVVKLNNQMPIQNGYYNDSVQLDILEKENYVPGSISVAVKLNGVKLEQKTSNYLFTDYGTYRINISAKYTNHKNEEIELSKEVVFTILNKKEVARSVDLSCLGKCEIVKVLNNSNVDVTEAFMSMLNSSDEGLNITYDLIMKHSTELGVSAGKLNFDITYKIKDGVYPERTHKLSICLNNEKPSIDCTLKSGEKSTKGFTITYNGAILYQQIGEADIKINGKTVATIDENSANSVSKIRKSFKASGAGDYYVQIVSSSGEVWESFRVTIKEPLNAWAIIVIVVVVLVVAAVVVTIIVLRRKMRIR